MNSIFVILVISGAGLLFYGIKRDITPCVLMGTAFLAVACICALFVIENIDADDEKGAQEPEQTVLHHSGEDNQGMEG
jgi:hypothetical protein